MRHALLAVGLFLVLIWSVPCSLPARASVADELSAGPDEFRAP